MHFPTIIALGLALIQSSYAAPAVSSIGVLSQRSVDKLSPGDELIECPNAYYSRMLVEEAIQQGIITTPRTAPQPGGYPKKFGNNRKLDFPNCKGKQLWEFPIKPGGNVFGGGPPGADRVVFTIKTKNPDTNPTDDGVYCGVMTHDNVCVSKADVPG